MITKSIVIAKYNEDISWIKNLDKKDFKIYLYDKKNTETNIPDIIFKHLPNVGREAHTYLTHIIENYDNLTDLILFTQGRWNDHLPDILSLFDKPNFFNNNTLPYNFQISFWQTPLEREPEGLCFGKWMEKYVESDIKNYANNFKWTPGAIFCVKKENILSRSLEYYENLIKQLQTFNPESLHFFERGWRYIFNIHKLESEKEKNIIKVNNFNSKYRNS